MENNDFMREKIKARPVNREKLIHKSIITLVLAVVFGLVSCFTFLVLEPVISNMIYPKDMTGKVVLLPEDREEMLPQDMLSDKINGEGKGEIVVLNEEQMEILIQNVTFDRTDYQNIYSSMAEYMNELRQYMVEIVGIESDMDWFHNVYENQNKTSGVIISKNLEYYMILTDYNNIKKADRLEVTLSNGEKVPATMFNYLSTANLAILRISVNDLSDATRKKGLSVASLGASYNDKLKGTVGIAMGCPLGTYDSVGYGIVTSTSNRSDMVDLKLQLINTEINASTNATGVLFDMNRRVLGLITPNKGTADTRYTATAYAVSDLKRIINYMLKEEKFPYIGITGMEVTEEVSKQYQVPFGIYVKDVVLDSPAMRAGIQKGDIITAMDGTDVKDMNDYTDILLKKDIGSTVTFGMMRQSQEAYKSMKVAVTISELE